ncbi:MAG TPA: PhzF family phenazine biosynthesis protein [Candidatus Aminicenantes bacterium]|nr:PhzF family phenazine biosynthesis protein [Candidatus Aminicenantes bacterium]HRY64943.1 PhzF family phenazine biosynthesis protein [Candidatus Aminicenantes bacterium]HRZ71856.1 PhzF family phenazine biosynthesis protein [Candidatus Aminicenantes bacterium]
MAVPIYQVDSFTEEPFKGNPAGVCLLREPADPAWMQGVAAEMNVAETAFPLAEGDGFRLRWFTPKTEVRLCGHATLAAAHILWESGVLAPGREARFQTLSGLLTARRDGDLVELDFPARPPLPRAPEWIDAVAGALGLKPAAVVMSAEDVLFEAADEEAVRAVEPDFAVLRTLPARGVIVTSRAAGKGCDFVSRFFAPAVGIDEDPVTGSSHTVLVPYWAAKLGKTSFTARQLSARGGVLHLRLDGERVKIAGRAVTVIRGEILV